jgi:NTE family protein
MTGFRPKGRPRSYALSLALQGGGAHGAFTWGVLDRLLEEDAVDVRALSGTSAGAINAVALASGWCHGGRDGARAALDQLWRTVAREGARASIGQGAFSAFALDLAAHLFSPYEFNPLDINPLRELLNELIDFEALRALSPMPLLIAATHIRTGTCRIFREHELTADMVLASACLPRLHHAIEIDGDAYWDGGFVSNPPVLPLAELGRSRRLVVVRINPTDGAHSLRKASAIRDRTATIVFGRPLAAELEQFVELQRVGRAPLGMIQPRLRRLARLEVETIDGDETLAHLDPITRVVPEASLLEHLRAEGRAAADVWLHGRAAPTPQTMPSRRASGELHPTGSL